MRTGGKAGGSAPLAMMCSGACDGGIVEIDEIAVRTLTAPTENRFSPLLMRSKSTSFQQRVAQRGRVVEAVAPSAPRGSIQGSESAA